MLLAVCCIPLLVVPCQVICLMLTFRCYFKTRRHTQHTYTQTNYHNVFAICDRKVNHTYAIHGILEKLRVHVLQRSRSRLDISACCIPCLSCDCHCSCYLVVISYSFLFCFTFYLYIRTTAISSFVCVSIS